jgi:hypothetical protein
VRFSPPVVGIEPYGFDWAPGDVTDGTLDSRIGFPLLVVLAGNGCPRGVGRLLGDRAALPVRSAQRLWPAVRS